jgi:hypothetical protein
MPTPSTFTKYVPAAKLETEIDAFNVDGLSSAISSAPAEFNNSTLASKQAAVLFCGSSDQGRTFKVKFDVCDNVNLKKSTSSVLSIKPESENEFETIVIGVALDIILA